MLTYDLERIATDIMRLCGAENEHEKIVEILQALVEDTLWWGGGIDK